MPPIFLNEEEVGVSDIVAYPHLLLCCGVTLVLSNGTLAGGHITTPNNSAQTVCQRVAGLVGGNTIERVYFTGNLTVHKRAARDYTGYLNYQGDVYLYDTKRLKYNDGTFVVITHNGTGTAPTVQYKDNQKMQYYTAQVPANPYGGKLPVITTGAKRSGLTDPVGPSLIGVSKLHGASVTKVRYPYGNQ